MFLSELPIVQVANPCSNCAVVSECLYVSIDPDCLKECVCVSKINSEMGGYPLQFLSCCTPKPTGGLGSPIAKPHQLAEDWWRITHARPDLARALSAQGPLETLFSAEDPLGNE